MLAAGFTPSTWTRDTNLLAFATITDRFNYFRGANKLADGTIDEAIALRVTTAAITRSVTRTFRGSWFVKMAGAEVANPWQLVDFYVG